MNRTHTLPAILYLSVTTLFCFVPGTFLNYGYDYYQFLPYGWLVVPIALCGALVALARWNGEVSARARLAFGVAAVCLCSVVFWCLRTRIHCFGGDGAVGHVVQAAFSLSDWSVPLPGKGRLDGYGLAFVAKCCRRLGLFDQFPVLTSILATQVYGVCMGVVFVAAALVGFRRRMEVFLVVLTAPFIFNFFGNVDSYAFSLVVALVFLVAADRALGACMEEGGGGITFRSMVGLAVLWGIGMWTHPFHVSDGFVLSAVFARWLRQKGRFRSMPDWCPSALFGLALFVAIKLSPNGNHWFRWGFAETPPTFSVDTLTHYLNMILLPSLPVIGCMFVEHRRHAMFRTALVAFGGASACFFAMAFTLGAVDQFNYQHLLFFAMAPFLLMLSRLGLSRQAVAAVVVCQAALLIPMVAVHSSVRTIARAEALYPIDPCRHNRVMSWQTHLGLCLGDNLQDDPAIRKAVLRAFANGARHAMPEGFRGGNLVYHTAFLYHFGEFERGRAQLRQILGQNPEAVKWFLGERPSFIYCNRRRLWDDICQFLHETKSPMLGDVCAVVGQLADYCRAHPYCMRRPSYAVTEY